MILGVTEQEQKIIVDILKDYSGKYSFYFYGSRVKGNFSRVSDLDVLIKGESEMPLSELVKLKEKFDESRLPYIVNFTDYHNIDERFYNLIKDDLVSVSEN